jgi:hypothetical protein
MAYFDKAWYVNSVGYTAVAPRSGGASVGQIVRQSVVPALNEERCFVCIVGGAGGGSDPAWVLTHGAKTVDGGVTWQECTGGSAVNGDLASTVSWSTVKGKDVSIGQVVKNAGATSYHICSTAGTAGTGAEPVFSNVAGSTIFDGTVTWTSLGAVGNFTKGGAPHARIANAGANPWFVSDGVIYVGDNHAEVQSTDDLEFVTSYPAQDPLHIGKMLCHKHDGNYPPTDAELTTGATVSTAGNFPIAWVAGGSFYVYGITFKAGVGTSSTNALIKIGPQGGGNLQNWTHFDHCSFWLASTGFNYIVMGQFVCEVVIFDNTTVRFSNIQCAIIPKQTRFIWCNTAPIFVSDSLIPPVLIYSGSAAINHIDVLFEACDLSQFYNKLYVNNSWWLGTIILKNCKLNPAMTCDTGLLGYPGNTVEFMCSDTGVATTRSDRYVLEGVDLTETSVVRTGGAVDPTGQPQSRKLVTSPAAIWLRPLQAKQFSVWVLVPDEPMTFTVYGLAAPPLPMNDEIWLEAEYLVDPDSTLGAVITSTKATVLSPNSVVASDSSVWANVPAGGVPFKLAVTVTPALAGYVHIRVMVARPNATFYIDPQVVLG